jgi:hypothetical protein
LPEQLRGRAPLHGVEPTLKQAFSLPTANPPGDSMAIAVPGAEVYGSTLPAGTGVTISYSISTTSPSKVQYALVKYSDGTVARPASVHPARPVSRCSSYAWPWPRQSSWSSG